MKWKIIQQCFTMKVIIIAKIGKFKPYGIWYLAKKEHPLKKEIT